MGECDGVRAVHREVAVSRGVCPAMIPVESSRGCECVVPRSPPRTLNLVIPTGAGTIATAEWRDPLLRRVAQAFDLAGATTQWVPQPSRAFREGWAAIRSHDGMLPSPRESK